MKAIKSAGIFLAAVLLAARAMAQQTEELKVPLSDPGKPYKLSAEIIFGNIKVTGYDGKEVIIEAQNDGKKRNNDDDDDHDRRNSSSGMKRISGNPGMDITAREKNNVVTITTDMPMRSLNLNIKVPQGITSLKLSGINGRSITVINVNSNIEVNGTNCAVILTDVSGSVVANTINGTIKANLKSVDNKSPMAFSTLNGNIDVTFPANFKSNVKLKSDRGSIFTDFDIATDKSTKTENSQKDGMYRLTVDETIYGKIDGGGPDLLIKTMNGSIYLRKAK